MTATHLILELMVMKKISLFALLLIPFLFNCRYSEYGNYKKERGKLCISGIAIDAKAGAVVQTSKMGIFYIEGIKSWDKDIAGQEIIVLGRLITIDHGLANAEFQKIGGIQKIVIKPKWKLISDDSWKI